MAAFPLPSWLAFLQGSNAKAPWCRTALATEASLQGAVDALAKQLQAQPCAAPAGGVAAGAVTTPPGKAGRRMAASPRPSKPALLCQSAAQRASRKRDASSGDVMDPGAEAGDGPAKRRWTGRRRSSETEEIVTEAMAVDGQDGEKESATQGMMGGQRRGKRARRGSADVAAKLVGAAVPAKRLARR